MRELLVIPIFLSFLVLTFAAPFVGVLTWTWLTLMAPQTLLWGVLSGKPLNLIVVAVLALAWLLSREPKRIPVNALTILLTIFIGVMTLSTTFSLVPDYSWEYWNRNLKIMLLGYVVATMTNTRVRVHAMIWVIAISLGYFGMTGGLLTLLTGGNAPVIGAIHSRVEDNNALALVLCMTIPLFNYLRLQSRIRFIRFSLVAAMVLTVVAVLGTHSRGGLVGLGAASLYFWWKSDTKLVIAFIGSIVLFAAVSLMPPAWDAYMGALANPQEEGSFRLRLQAWAFAINVALERPFLGGGFNAGQLLEVYRQFLPGYTGVVKGRASHSIYFQVLADHGFLGFFVYISMLALLWWMTIDIMKRTAHQSRWQWMNQLAKMIQVSLLAFYVGGAALSVAYYDLFYILLGLVVAMRGILVESVVKSQPGRLPLASARTSVRVRPTTVR